MQVIKDGGQWLHVINYLAVVICFKASPLKGVFVILESFIWEQGET